MLPEPETNVPEPEVLRFVVVAMKDGVVEAAYGPFADYAKADEFATYAGSADAVHGYSYEVVKTFHPSVWSEG